MDPYEVINAKPLVQQDARIGMFREAKALVKLMRPHQWIKNGFVLVGVLFSFSWISAREWQDAFTAFASFCCAASAVYVFNDLRDAESDRAHPKKCFRPIAAGIVRPALAGVLGSVLVLAACVLAWLASGKVLIFVLGYFLINVAYTLKFKQEVVLDVFCIFAGFMMRLLAGTIGIGIQPSRWLLITGMMITLFLGFGKRRAELASASGTSSRKSLHAYSLPLLDKFITICAASTLVTYGLYTVDSRTVAMHHTENLIWTMPIVAFGLFRYLYLIHHAGKGEDTSRDLVRDPSMLVTVLCWVASVLVIVRL